MFCTSRDFGVNKISHCKQTLRAGGGAKNILAAFTTIEAAAAKHDCDGLSHRKHSSLIYCWMRRNKPGVPEFTVLV